MEDNQCRRLLPRPRLRTLRFLFSTDNLGARRTSNVEAIGSHSSLFSHSSDEVLSSTVARHTLVVDSWVLHPFFRPRTREQRARLPDSARVRNNNCDRPRELVSSPDPTHKWERFPGCAVSAERTRLHTVQYVLCHMRAVWLSHDC